MALWILVDDFSGDPDEFYKLVQQQIQSCAIPGIKFGIDWVAGKKTGWFSRQKIKALVVHDKLNREVIVAFPYGNGFAVATRSFWQDYGMKEKEKQGKLTWGEEMDSSLFAESVDRAVREALALYVEQDARTAPKGLREERALFERAPQVVEE